MATDAPEDKKDLPRVYPPDADLSYRKHYEPKNLTWADIEPSRSKFVNSFLNLGWYMFVEPAKAARRLLRDGHQEYPWYHRRFQRVPGIEECNINDAVCVWEANEQFKRDKQIERKILNILDRRVRDCHVYESPHDYSEDSPCFDMEKTHKEAQVNFHIKYGELGYAGNAQQALMKQKHRMLWERRHGPVGGGVDPSKVYPDEVPMPTKYLPHPPTQSKTPESKREYNISADFKW